MLQVLAPCPGGHAPCSTPRLAVFAMAPASGYLMRTWTTCGAALTLRTCCAGTKGFLVSRAAPSTAVGLSRVGGLQRPSPPQLQVHQPCPPLEPLDRTIGLDLLHALGVQPVERVGLDVVEVQGRAANALPPRAANVANALPVQPLRLLGPPPA